MHVLGDLDDPKSRAGRVLFISWRFFCIIIIAIYTGNLIAFIAVIRIKYPFQSLEEMVDGDHLYGVLGSTYTHTLLTVNIYYYSYILIRNAHFLYISLFLLLQ